MTYSESARGIKISEARAVRELRDHGFTQADDVAEALTYAKRTAGAYSASKLLEWLGERLLDMRRAVEILDQRS